MTHTIVTINKTPARNILTLEGKIGKDEIIMEQLGKSVLITAFVDGTGTEVKISKQQLIDWLWVR